MPLATNASQTKWANCVILKKQIRAFHCLAKTMENATTSPTHTLIIVRAMRISRENHAKLKSIHATGKA